MREKEAEDDGNILRGYFEKAVLSTAGAMRNSLGKIESWCFLKVSHHSRRIDMLGNAEPESPVGFFTADFLATVNAAGERNTTRDKS